MINIILADSMEYLDSIVDFQKEMAIETENMVLKHEKIYSGISTALGDPSIAKYYLAFMGDEFVGMLMTQTEWSDWRSSKMIWIHSVFVKKEFRGKGVYKSLYNHIENLVKSTPEYCGIRLYVDKSNLNAQKVYRSLGMKNEHYELFEWLK